MVPADDQNLFLETSAADQPAPDRFSVTAALRPRETAGLLDGPFTVSLKATVTYLNRANGQETVDLDVPAFATPISGVWRANETITCTAGQAETDCMRASFVNPHYEFQVPRLDIADLNQRFLASGELDRQLDPDRADTAVVQITATLDAAELQDKARLLISTGNTVIAESPGAIIGVADSVMLSADTLLAGIGGEEHRDTADAYYRTIDPQNRRTTLNDWLFLAGFAQDNKGSLKPDAVSGVGEFAHAKYTNNFDLGFGRDMYMRTDPSGDVYAFVVNYPTLEAAIKNIDNFVAVVMEFTPPDDTALEASCATKGRFVKFLTFVPDNSGNAPRVGSMNFDGRGERYTPGNCIACHGGDVANLDQLVAAGNSNQMVYRNCGDTNAAFMLWDLDSFLYSDTDPAIANGVPKFGGASLLDETDPAHKYSRQAQEEQFRKLNAGALQTYETFATEGGDPNRVAAAMALVHGWYHDRTTVAGTPFDGTYTPDGWNTSPAVADAYQNGFARYCRACHTMLADSSKHFDSYDNFTIDPMSQTPRDLEDIVYRRGVMPLARLSMDRFWVPFHGTAVPAETLANVLAADIGLDPTARPGAPVFQITRTPDPAKERDIVRLNAADSAFVRSPQWTALASTANGACEQPTLSGANTMEVAFRAATPGHYCIQLASGASSRVEEFDVNADAPPVRVQKTALTIDENAGPTAIDLEYSDADDPPANLVYSLVSALNGTVSLNGVALASGDTFTQQQISAGLVRFKPSLGGVNLAAGVLVDGGLDYTLTDGITVLGPPALQYRVNILGVNDGQPTVTVSPVTASQLVFGGNVSIGASRISASDPDTAAAGLTVSISVAGTPAGTVTPASLTYQQILNGSSFTYHHLGAFPIDLSDQLQVVVSDGTNTSSPVPLAVTARVSFAQNVIPVMTSATGNADTNSCMSCHSTAGPGPAFGTGTGPYTVTYTAVDNEVVGTLPAGEPACNATPGTAASALLRRPSGLDGHSGGVRAGFGLNGNLNNYELFRTWICGFGAGNN